MIDLLRKNIYLNKANFLYKQGVINQKIVPFDDEFYEKLSHTYISSLPVSIHIKYLKPTLPPGKYYDRSLYMFFCFDNAILVRGDSKDLELEYGKKDAEHGWIEIDNYVYDASSLLRFDKDLYYEIYKPTNIKKYTIKEYCKSKECKDLYEEVKNTTIDDFKPNGKRRTELSIAIPLVSSIASLSNDEQFTLDLNTYLEEINYDEKEIYNELKTKMKKELVKNKQTYI